MRVFVLALLFLFSVVSFGVEYQMDTIEGQTNFNEDLKSHLLFLNSKNDFSQADSDQAGFAQVFYLNVEVARTTMLLALKNFGHDEFLWDELKIFFQTALSDSGIKDKLEGTDYAGALFWVEFLQSEVQNLDQKRESPSAKERKSSDTVEVFNVDTTMTLASSQLEALRKKHLEQLKKLRENQISQAVGPIGKLERKVQNWSYGLFVASLGVIFGGLYYYTKIEIPEWLEMMGLRHGVNFSDTRVSLTASFLGMALSWLSVTKTGLKTKAFEWSQSLMMSYAKRYRFCLKKMKQLLLSQSQEVELYQLVGSLGAHKRDHIVTHAAREVLLDVETELSTQELKKMIELDLSSGRVSAAQPLMEEVLRRVGKILPPEADFDQMQEAYELMIKESGRTITWFPNVSSSHIGTRVFLTLGGFGLSVFMPQDFAYSYGQWVLMGLVWAGVIPTVFRWAAQGLVEIWNGRKARREHPKRVKMFYELLVEAPGFGSLLMKHLVFVKGLNAGVQTAFYRAATEALDKYVDDHRDSEHPTYSEVLQVRSDLLSYRWRFGDYDVTGRLADTESSADSTEQSLGINRQCVDGIQEAS